MMAEVTGKVAIGIDVGGTRIKVVKLVQDQADRIAMSPPYCKLGMKDLAEHIRQCVKEVAGGSEVAAIGLCLPGVVEGGRVVRSVNLPGLEGEQIEALFEGGEGVCCAGGVRVFSDAHAAGFDLSRKWEGGHGGGRLACVSIGTGVGLAVLDGGELVCVSGGSSGHLGQVDVCPDAWPDLGAPVGGDGGRGSLESYVGYRALVGRYGSEEIGEIERGLERDDTPIRALARGLRVVHAIYRPGAIYLAGGVGLAMGSCLEQLDELVREGLTNLSIDGWKLGVGESLHHAARGAALLALKEQIER